MSDISLNAPALFDLSDRVALVTGAGSGIGQRIAIGLAQCGADVALLDRRTDNGLADTADAIASSGRKSLQIAADVTSGEAMAAAVAQTEAELGPLRLALNAAGIANADGIEDMPEEQYQTLMDINMKGIWLSCQAEGRAMLAHGQGGSIVNIASMSGVIVNRGLKQVHYNASKAGVIHMSKYMSKSRPEMIHQTKEFESQTPMQRMADVNEMVGPAVFLLSDAASYCTGVSMSQERCIAERQSFPVNPMENPQCRI